MKPAEYGEYVQHIPDEQAHYCLIEKPNDTKEPVRELGLKRKFQNYYKVSLSREANSRSI